MPSSVTIFTVTKLRPGLQIMTFASVIFISIRTKRDERRFPQAARAKAAPHQDFIRNSFSRPASARFFGRPLETITDPRLGVNVAWMMRLRFDFFAQLIDEDTQVFHLLAVVGTPNRLQKAPMRQGLPLMHNQMTKQLEFLWRKAYRLAFYQDQAFLEVDFQIRGDKRGKGFGRRSTTQGGSNTSH